MAAMCRPTCSQENGFWCQRRKWEEQRCFYFLLYANLWLALSFLFFFDFCFVALCLTVWTDNILGHEVREADSPKLSFESSSPAVRVPAPDSHPAHGARKRILNQAPQLISSCPREQIGMKRLVSVVGCRPRSVFSSRFLPCITLRGWGGRAVWSQRVQSLLWSFMTARSCSCLLSHCTSWKMPHKRRAGMKLKC